ncbi:MAG: InlB B-repeat-containing protein, partial [Lachnospiraceae bacterium]|nr:InlB B-repeat-containing protein [Lachnospiraceae bacterium]
SDSAISIGWKNLEIRPYELIHKRIAFLARARTYYVNADEGDDNRSGTSAQATIPGTSVIKSGGGRPGAFDYPFRTIGKALQAIQSAGAQKAFICLQTPNIEFPEGITEFTNGKDITFQTADIDIYGKKIRDIYSFNIATNSQFKIGLNGAVTFQNMILDGQNQVRTTPFIVQDNGLVSLSSGTTFKNFNNKNGAAVVDTTGSGRLGVFGTTIENCISNDKVINAGTENVATISCCAITYDGATGTDTVVGFEMNGANKVISNYDTNGNKRNIYLADEKFIQVSNLLKNEATGAETEVSITTEKLPTAYIGAVKNANEEVIVAKPTGDYPNISGINNCPFEQYFYDDRTSTNNRIEIAEGKINGGDTAKKNAVVKQLGSRIIFKYVNENGSTLRGISRSDLVLPVGQQVTIEATPSILTGYEMDRCQVTGTGFTIDNVKTSATFGTATGTVGTTNVEIRYIYKPQDVSYSFVSNGGSPTSIPAVTGQVGKRVSGILSQPKKYGYLFAGWYDNIDDPYDTSDAGKFTQLPTYFPNKSLTLYAKYN